MNCENTNKGMHPPLSEPDSRFFEVSRLYSEELMIDLSHGSESDLFRWLLASIFFGGRISEAIARKTYQAFLRHRLRTPQAILKAGRDFLISPVMREGGYVRYDGRKSRQVVDDCRMLMSEYGGRVSRIAKGALRNAELEERLCAFPGIGPVTANIFLRELRPYWPAADPEPLAAIVETARALGLDLDSYDRKNIVFARVEAGLIRYLHAHRTPPAGDNRDWGP